MTTALSLPAEIPVGGHTAVLTEAPDDLRGLRVMPVFSIQTQGPPENRVRILIRLARPGPVNGDRPLVVYEASLPAEGGPELDMRNVTAAVMGLSKGEV